MGTAIHVERAHPKMIQISSEIAGLIGVVLGFGLSEFSQYVKYRGRIRRLRVVVTEELKSIRQQISQKTEILDQAITKLKQKRIRPTLSVHALTIGYRSVLGELYGHLGDLDRNCLHVIYEYLRVGDETMDRFETDIVRALKEKIIDDPYEMYAGRLGEVLSAYQQAEKLIDSYLEGKPIDVFHVAAQK